MNRLEKALIQTRQEILEVQRKVSEGMGAQEGGIFDAHLLVLEDRTLLDEVVRVIQQEKVNAEYAFHSVAERYATTLAAIQDEYLRDAQTICRVAEVQFLGYGDEVSKLSELDPVHGPPSVEELVDLLIGHADEVASLGHRASFTAGRRT